MEDDDNYGLYENPFGMNDEGALIGPPDELSDLGMSLSNLPLDDNSHMFISPTVDRLEIDNEAGILYPFSPDRMQSPDGVLSIPNNNSNDFSFDQSHQIQQQLSQMPYQQQQQQQPIEQPIITTSTTVIPIQSIPPPLPPPQPQFQQQQIQQQFMQQQQIQLQAIQRQQQEQQLLFQQQQQQQSLLQTPNISISQYHQPLSASLPPQPQQSTPPLQPSSFPLQQSSRHRRSKSNLTPLMRYSHTRSQSDSSAAFAIINHNLGLNQQGSPNINGNNSSDTNKSEGGKRYLCSRCHQCKKGHICPFPIVRKGSVDYSQMISSETQVDLSITATPPYLSDHENNNYNEKILFPRPYNSVNEERESNISGYGSGYDG